jgi:hypothetical protein
MARDPIEALEAVIARHPTLWRLYVALNFCKEAYADGTPKVDGPLFNVFKRVFYLECACCAALRGILVGLLAGAAAGVLLCLK